MLDNFEVDNSNYYGSLKTVHHTMYPLLPFFFPKSKLYFKKSLLPFTFFITLIKLKLEESAKNGKFMRRRMFRYYLENNLFTFLDQFYKTDKNKQI